MLTHLIIFIILYLDLYRVQKYTKKIMKLMPLVPVQSTSRDPPIQITHKCQIASKKDQLEILLPGNTWRDRVIRSIARHCVLLWKHPKIKRSIKSTAAVNYEIKKHIQIHPCMIYPFSSFRNFWELFMTIFMIISLCLIPYIIAFEFYQTQKWLELLLIINLFFFLDTILCFFTGYYDPTTRVVVLDREIVIRKYLKSFFLLDLISAIPVHLIFTIVAVRKEPKWYWTILSLCKMFRIRNLFIYSGKLCQHYRISFQTSKILKTLMIFILFIHWATCLELYIALIGKEINGKTIDRPSWLSSNFMKTRNTTFQVYIACANRAVIALCSSSHYMDMKTIEDILLNIFLTVLGRIGFIYISAQFFQLMTTFHSTRKKNVKLLQQLMEYLQYRELPRHVQQRVLTYYTYWCNKSFQRDKLIISNVSPILREELLMHSCAKLIQNVEFFKHLPESLVPQMIMLLKVEIFLANDTLVTAGTIGDAMYYIVSGTVAILNRRSEVICHLEDGSYFGEVALVMENEKRLATVIALETCEVYILKRSDFLNIIKPYPNLISRLQKLAIEKLDKSVLAETLHKRDGSIATSINIYESITE